MSLDLKNYVEKGISFQHYLSDIQNDIEIDNNESGLLEHTVLNDKRMKRLYKTLKLSDEQKSELQSIQTKITLLIITEGWCGDASQILPMVDLIQREIPNAEAKVVYRDQNPELMDEYETNGSRAIPIIIGVNENNQEVFRYGPRPSFGMDLLKKHKNDPIGYPKSQFYPDLQMAYNKDKGQTIYSELVQQIKNI